MAKKILIIEDEPGQILMLGTRLKAVGYKIVSAGDGEEGLKMVSTENPDLILLDIILPKIDGYKVCKSVKENPDIAKIPIIMITAAGVKDLEEKCKAAGADALIRKPYECTDLVKKIKDLLGE